MGRGFVRTLLSLPCRRDRHTWTGPFSGGVYLCAACKEPGFEVPKLVPGKRGG